MIFLGLLDWLWIEKDRNDDNTNFYQYDDALKKKRNDVTGSDTTSDWNACWNYNFFLCDGQGRDGRNTVIQCDDVLRKISDAIWIRHAYGSEWKLMLRSESTSWTTWNEKNMTCLLHRWEFETADVSMTGNETFPRWGSDDSYLRYDLWLACTFRETC